MGISAFYNVIGWLILAFALLLIYFQLAKRFQIMDIPNERSSHSHTTIRGAGIIFPVVFLLSCFYEGFDWWYFVGGLALVALISFLDDLKPLKPRWRGLGYGLGIVLLLADVEMPIYGKLCACVLIFGILNAYNFMDGINGITALYSLVTVGSLYWIKPFVPVEGLGMALLAFAWFNVRKRARCFSGDVGSISIAFILCFAILNLMLLSGHWEYVLLLVIYGLDSVATIVLRIIRKEKIWDAHRSHFYQYLANERKWTHVSISALYALVQLGLNVLLIRGEFHLTLCLFIVIILMYSWSRIKLEGYYKLLVNYKG